MSGGVSFPTLAEGRWSCCLAMPPFLDFDGRSSLRAPRPSVACPVRLSLNQATTLYHGTAWSTWTRSRASPSACSPNESGALLMSGCGSFARRSKSPLTATAEPSTFAVARRAHERPPVVVAIGEWRYIGRGYRTPKAARARGVEETRFVSMHSVRSAVTDVRATRGNRRRRGRAGPARALPRR